METYVRMMTLDEQELAFETLAGRVVLVVNVASLCGFTPQYAGLQALYQSRRDAGLVLLGVPCNQFGGQEPGSPDDIRTFCTLEYGVTFPLLARQEVNGPRRSPLYARLVGDGPDVRWNFEKFLVGRDGRVHGRFASDIKPDAPALLAAIDAALAPMVRPQPPEVP